MGPLTFALWLAAAPSPEGVAAELEGRLLAPCCWNGTLDIHGSPLASSLRAEILRRLTAGESVVVIEADLVARHGERIRAIPYPGFLGPLGKGLLAVAALAFLGVLGFGRRRTQPPTPAPPPIVSGPGRRELDQALFDLEP